MRMIKGEPGTMAGTGGSGRYTFLRVKSARRRRLLVSVWRIGFPGPGQWGAQEGTRTPTPLREADFKSAASACFRHLGLPAALRGACLSVRTGNKANSTSNRVKVTPTCALGPS